MGEAAVEAAKRSGRLCRRGHRRVHRRRLQRAQSRRLLVHGDEHAAAGRASGDGSRSRASIWWNGSSAIAAGERLPLMQAEVPLNGHAVEARLYAGRSGARVPAIDRQAGGAVSFRDAMACASTPGSSRGGDISPYYDPMIAKMIAHAPTRSEALDAAGAGARSKRLLPARAPISRFLACCAVRRISATAYSTQAISPIITRNLALASAASMPARQRAALRILLAQPDRVADNEAHRPAASPWDVADGFQLSGPRRTTLPILVNGEPDVAVLDYAGGTQHMTVPGMEPIWTPGSSLRDHPSMCCVTDGRRW